VQAVLAALDRGGRGGEGREEREGREGEGNCKAACLPSADSNQLNGALRDRHAESHPQENGDCQGKVESHGHTNEKASSHFPTTFQQIND